MRFNTCKRIRVGLDCVTGKSPACPPIRMQLDPVELRLSAISMNEKNSGRQIDAMADISVWEVAQICRVQSASEADY